MSHQTHMKISTHSSNILFYYGLFVSACSAFVAAGIFASPSEAESALAFGLSLPRLAMMFGLLVALVFFAALAWRAYRNHEWAEQIVERWFGGKGVSAGLNRLSRISCGLSLIGVFLPAYHVGTLSGYWERIQPLMMFILFASIATQAVFFVMQVKELNLKSLRLGLPLFGACLLVGMIMFTSGFGVASSLEDFWYGAGVPVLTAQLIVALLAGIIFLRFDSRMGSKRADVLICIFLFAMTALLWAHEPLQKSFLFTKPYAPDNKIFPFADAAMFDAASQFPLIGEKFWIFNGHFFERPLYLAFLTYLHSFFGQDYETVMMAQAVLFAILPVLIYSIGRSLGTRPVGFATALVATFRGLNAIHASNLLDTAGPKMILTDFPTAIGVALIILFVCEWWQKPNERRHYPLWIGGLIGATLMLRTNGLILFAFMPFIAWFIIARKWRQWIVSSVLILLGVVAITIPWEIRNVSLGVDIYAPIVMKFRGVLQQRYQTPPQDPVTQPVSAPANNINPNCNNVICFTINHLLHNIMMSVLVLPTSPMLDDVRYLIKERAPYWNPTWDGSLKGIADLMLILNLFFITTGIARAWQEKRLLGLIPLAIFLVYNLSNGLARTSGGRYVVPADWIITFYFLLGIFHIASWLANATGRSWEVFSIQRARQSLNQKPPAMKSLNAITTLLIVGALLPLSENLHLPRYQNNDPYETLLENRPLVESAGLQIYDLDAFLHNPDALILIGRALYPRTYHMNQGEFQDAFYPYQILGFPRVAFTLIGPDGNHGIILPASDIVRDIHHASDVLVIGCKTVEYVDALIVIVLGDEHTIYSRQPASALQCPLQQPVCDNNSACR